MAKEIFKVKEVACEPQTVGAQLVPASTSTDANGKVNVLSWAREIAVLRSRIMIVEARGYTRSEADAITTNGSSSVLYNGKFAFEERSVSYEKQRVNEADMWRITKIVTIKALYVNGQFIAGKTSFNAGDETSL